MMIPVYQESLLRNAQNNIGYCFDYLINDCDLSISKTMDYFRLSSISKQFERGNTKFILGSSGYELGMDILSEIEQREEFHTPTYHEVPTKEYWAGTALAYFQWKTNKTFEQIFNVITLQSIRNMYQTYHQVSFEKFTDDLLEVYFSNVITNLKKRRKANKLSQKELATQAKINLRSIQMYEQRQNDINKAQAGTLYRIAKVLNCRMEDLLE